MGELAARPPRHQMKHVTVELLHLIGLAGLALAVVGSLYALAAALLSRRFLARPACPASRFPGVTILKPLLGAEPGLYDNLASFCRQAYPGPVQVVFGVKDARDPAAAVARRLIADHPGADLELVTDGRTHGANGKISNLINMAGSIRHDVLALADSDIQVGPDYLGHLVGALEQPGVGMVTCLYRGIPAPGLWSRLAALGVNHHFLPSVMVGLGVGRAKPCFGATMALRRETLAEIGGFQAFANHLADDHAMGEAVRRTGARVAIPSVMVDHICRAHSAGELLGHELRWARTVRLLDPAGFLGSAITHPLPFALVALALLPNGPWGQGALGLALLSRLALQTQVNRAISGAGSASTPGAWLLGPLRDLLSFAVFVASHFTNAISWRGQRFRVRRDGTLIPAKDMAS